MTRAERQRIPPQIMSELCTSTTDLVVWRKLWNPTKTPQQPEITTLSLGLTESQNQAIYWVNP